jgi:hypothetical protein
MSAFIVSKAHIDRIVSTANRWRYSDMRMSPDDLGRMLWLENLKSVAYRYPDDRDGDRPGPSGLTDDQIAHYRWTPTPELTPVEALKAIRCYDYQSCEHPGYETSQARRFVQIFTEEAISRLPGYDRATWEWVS